MRQKGHVAVVVDSAASLPEDLSRYPQLYVAPMRLTIGDQTFLDGRDLRPTDFYRMLTQSPVLPTTASPAPASFLEAFREAAEETGRIQCLTVASQFSSSFDSASAAVREAKESMPDVEISVLDTRSAAGSEGLVALEAWRMARRGGSLRQVREAAESVIPRVRFFAFLDTLYYLWKSGRVPRIAYAGASLLQIKPLIELDQGEVRPIARPRTHRRAMARLLELMRARAGSGRVHATVVHADSPRSARELMERIETEFRCEELFISEFSPVMGAHTGPGLVGIAFWTE